MFSKCSFNFFEQCITLNHMQREGSRIDRSAIDVKCKGKYHQDKGFSSIDKGNIFKHN